MGWGLVVCVRAWVRRARLRTCEELVERDAHAGRDRAEARLRRERHGAPPRCTEIDNVAWLQAYNGARCAFIMLAPARLSRCTNASRTAPRDNNIMMRVYNFARYRCCTLLMVLVRVRACARAWGLVAFELGDAVARHDEHQHKNQREHRRHRQP